MGRWRYLTAAARVPKSRGHPSGLNLIRLRYLYLRGASTPGTCVALFLFITFGT